MHIFKLHGFTYDFRCYLFAWFWLQKRTTDSIWSVAQRFCFPYNLSLQLNWMDHTQSGFSIFLFERLNMIFDEKNQSFEFAKVKEKGKRGKKGKTESTKRTANEEKKQNRGQTRKKRIKRILLLSMAPVVNLYFVFAHSVYIYFWMFVDIRDFLSFLLSYIKLSQWKHKYIYKNIYFFVPFCSLKIVQKQI